MNLLKICTKIIEYSFYSLFLLVPLAFTSATSELFEMNKMWLTWGLTIVIGMSWFAKMILQRKFFLKRTPLDIPIALFLLSQILSTIFSWDAHVSLWGYYSRFNGGLLSIMSYIFLYYAFLSNFISENSEPSSAGSEHSASQKFRQSDNLNIRKSGIPSFPSILNNNPIKMVKRLLFLGLISGLIVALWGLPSHFGYDPTCLLFRGTFDVSCWTADFQPRARIFSTLGQPAWLAAYLAILIPIAIAFWFQNTQNTQNVRISETQKIRRSDAPIHRVFRVFWNGKMPYIILIALFYIDLLYTGTRSGFLGIWIALLFFFAIYIFTAIRDKKPFGLPQGGQQIIKSFLPIASLLLLITFIIGTPINQLNRFTLGGLGSNFQKTQAPKTSVSPTPAPVQSFESGGPARRSLGEGGTESGDIRLNVWTGAISAWRANPIFGTGVETFAYAYYKYKPAGQNLTSEWNFLYNKAHNEYLNYLATTGILGLGSYLLIIGWFLFIAIKHLHFNISFRKTQNTQKTRFLDLSESQTIRLSDSPSFPSVLIIALLASYISILITNFFGFSVVITNIYLLMIPSFVFILGGTQNLEKNFIFPRSESKVNYASKTNKISLYQWTFILLIILASLFLLSNLFRFWQADIAYALGYNLDRAGEYQQAYPHLHKAVELRGDEMVFKDELSINDAILAAGLLAQQPSDNQKEQTISIASSLVQEAINTSNEILTKSPNNAVFWKTRVKLFYTLSQVDSRYLPKALEGIEKASLLAPNDANIWYNVGVLYGQSNNIKKGIEALEKTTKLKPDYRDAHYALGLFYRTASLDEGGKFVLNDDLNQKAILEMRYILDHIYPQDTSAMDSLKAWKQ